jgi:FlaA1/EpsC-like NDP-sugar epimerase
MPMAPRTIFQKGFWHYRKRLAVFAGDVALVAFSYYFSFLLRFDMQIPAHSVFLFLMTLPLALAIRLSSFGYFGMYSGVWRFASTSDLLSIIKGVSISSALFIIALSAINSFSGYPRSVLFIDWMVLMILLTGFRFSVKFCKEVNHLQRRGGFRTLLVGAGEAGESILREMIRNRGLNYHPVGLVDDNPSKIGKKIYGVPVLGDTQAIPSLVKKYKIREIIIAIPSAKGPDMRRIVAICKECPLPYKTLPGLGELIDGRVSVKKLREVNYLDLLGRPPVNLDITGIEGYLSGQCVLVTGGGGSIGSELCRQLIRFRPRNLIIVDAGEENLFRIQMELEHELHFKDFTALLARVENRSIMEAVFNKYRPEVVFHAAAYKHVPLVEQNPWEAVSNNIDASRVAMELARLYGVERFVLVSSDKAVHPTNVMGVSKRVSELLIQSFQETKTRFMAVRFGNVIGSSGSVIPLFLRQIERGGPITLTHPEATRYFMTVVEASRLILQAGGMGAGGEVFVLEMGTPIKILDLANDLIRLSGKKPDEDIRIKYTGLRPGEKLCEEYILGDETIVATSHPQVTILQTDGQPPSPEFKKRLNRLLDELSEAAAQMDAFRIKKLLREIVPEYRPRPTDLEKTKIIPYLPRRAQLKNKKRLATLTGGLPTGRETNGRPFFETGKKLSKVRAGEEE